MECPRCAAPAVPGAEACHRCGFTLSALLSAFGFDLVRLHRLMDDAHALRLQETRELEAALVDFEEHFPQLFFAVYLGVLPPQLSVSELGFLLLNRGVFWAEHHPRLNEHALVLVIDPEVRTACLMVGYALEDRLPPAFLQRVLRGVRTQLWHAEYVPAVVAVLREVARALRKGARRARRSDVLPPQAAEDFLGGALMRGRLPDGSPSEPGAGGEIDGGGHSWI